MFTASIFTNHEILYILRMPSTKNRVTSNKTLVIFLI
jgi:hypothetical protein